MRSLSLCHLSRSRLLQPDLRSGQGAGWTVLVQLSPGAAHCGRASVSSSVRRAGPWLPASVVVGKCSAESPVHRTGSRAARASPRSLSQGIKIIKTWMCPAQGWGPPRSPSCSRSGRLLPWVLLLPTEPSGAGPPPSPSNPRCW